MVSPTIAVPQHLSIRCSGDGQTAIWRISTRSNNITGSWVFPDGDDQLDTLVAGTEIIADPDHMTADLRQTLTDEIHRLDTAYLAFKGNTEHTLVPPTWPTITKPALPPSPNRPDAAAAALHPALQIERLLGTWAELEQERLRVLNGLLGYLVILDREIDKRANATAATSQRRLAPDQDKRGHTVTAIEAYQPDHSRPAPL